MNFKKTLESLLVIGGLVVGTEKAVSQNLEKQTIKYYLDYGLPKETNFKCEVFEKDSFQIESYSKKLAEKIVNEPFPNDVKIEYDENNLKENGEGRWISSERKIILSKKKYLSELLLMMHEYGHVFSRNQIDSMKYGELIMDEALAQCFEYATPYLVQNQNLSKCLINEINIENEMDLAIFAIAYRQIINGETDEYPSEETAHHLAEILAYSTLIYFNDPIKSCTYLRNTDYEEIEPEILEITKRIKSNPRVLRMLEKIKK